MDKERGGKGKGQGRNSWQAAEERRPVKVI